MCVDSVTLPQIEVLPEIEVLPIEDEVAPELVMFADWPTYEGAPSGG